MRKGCAVAWRPRSDGLHVLSRRQPLIDVFPPRRDLVVGSPKTVTVSSDEIREALTDQVNIVVDAVKQALERTPPELAADIVDKGIVLAGGGSPNHREI